MPFSTLLYRYFFYGWLFHDAGRGTLWQRHAAWRHNRAQARWLPTYMRRWLVVGVGLYAVAWVVERALGARCSRRSSMCRACCPCPSTP